MEIFDAIAHQALEMTFIEHDHMVGQIAARAERSHKKSEQNPKVAKHNLSFAREAAWLNLRLVLAGTL